MFVCVWLWVEVGEVEEGGYEVEGDGDGEEFGWDHGVGFLLCSAVWMAWYSVSCRVHQPVGLVGSASWPQGCLSVVSWTGH